MGSRIFCFILGFILINQFAFAQDKNYSDQWKKIEGLEKKGLTADALKEAELIFNDAVTKGNDPQEIKAAMYRMKYRNMTEENNSQKNILFIDTLIAKTKAPSKNILLSMKAQMLQSYKENNRYKLYERTALTEEKGNDISTWSINKLNAEISSYYKASLKNETLLKATSLKNFTAIINKGSNTENLRPTLYDLLANRALDYFMSSENYITDPSYKFIINDEKAFAPVTEFVQHRFITKDTVSLYYNALLILQDLLRFHLKDVSPDALLDADLKRLSFVNDNGIFSDKDKKYIAALEDIETAYSNNPVSTEAVYQHASMLKTNGDSYNPFTSKDHQFDLVKAKALCDAAYAKFPKSNGGIKCKNLSTQIKTPTLEFTTEKVNVPDQPFRAFIKFKNTPDVFVKIIKTTREEIEKIDTMDDEEKLSFTLKLPTVRSFHVALPDLKDFQQHATEIKIDALSPGTYIILTGRNENFSFKKNIICRAVTVVSNISYIINNKKEFYALNRDNGMPLQKASVQLWVNVYNSSGRRHQLIPSSAFITDQNGYAKIPRTKDYENNLIQVKYGNDELFTRDNYSNDQYNDYNNYNTGLKRSFLFTDRAIYRPGQTVYFKGILTQTSANGRKSIILPRTKTKLLFYNSNQQILGTLDLTTNDYGSYNGSFVIPEGTLNGMFYIKDTLTTTTASLNVEEYKRPTFSTEIKKPAGAYRVNDSITVTGIVKAFAGNNVGGANVVYHVTRVVRYPIWFGYYRTYFPQATNSMEITNGTTVTDADGNFKVIFKAIPDETVDKKDQPEFEYEIKADVTDITGETRSGDETVSVSYQALQINITGEARIAEDSLKHIGISSTNINGLFQQASINFSMYKLQEPGRIFRDRYWDRPDVFVMTKAEYVRDFPYDIYDDEDDINKWELKQKVIDVTDTTTANGTFKLPHPIFAGGWYKIIVTGKDAFGEPVKAEENIFITTAKTTGTDDPILVTTPNSTALPGDKIAYKIETGFDKIFLIENIMRPENKTSTLYAEISPAKPAADLIDVNDNDRGGIGIGYAFVKHNRWYSNTTLIDVPWDNKDLAITYETFRDKLLPASNEKWKIKISGKNAEKVAAEALVSMYDASLDEFKPQEWNSLSSLWPGNEDQLQWEGNSFDKTEAEQEGEMPDEALEEKVVDYPYLMNKGWDESGGNYDYFRSGVSYKLNAFAAAPPAAATYSFSVGSVDKAIDVPVYDSAGNLGTATKFRSANSNAELQSNFTVAGGDTKKENAPSNMSIRKNFNETAFFYPELHTDENGDIEFSFTMPEALTQWKLMVLAHTKELASAYDTRTVVTQKELMVQPNAPRFLREGDGMEFSAKVVNLTGKEITGTSTLELLDAATNNPVDGWFKNVFPLQYFTVPAGQSVAVKFPIEIPFSFNSAMTYRIKAISKDGSFSDGEEMAIPVLSNRILVTESMPLNMHGSGTQNFTFDKLLHANNSGSLTNHALTVEYTSNPAWYAVQALPYLMEYPYECAEQSFNRYYANTLASFISNASPKTKAVFEKWKITDTAALMSNLQKNEELKSVLLAETPWVLEAKSEAQQKKNIGLLFDMVRLAGEKNKTLAKLKDMQLDNGGFAWFKGGADDIYITQYIMSGIGHLRKLHALEGANYDELKPIVSKAVPYLDARIKEEYDNLIKYKVKLTQDNLSNTAIQYLYMRSFFPDEKINDASKKAVDYYTAQATKYRLGQSKYMQAMIALALHRNKDDKTAKAITESLRQNSITDPETGIYWKEFDQGSYWWYRAPIESQAMMIEAFSDIEGNNTMTDGLKLWLLKQKQTQQWPTTKATAEACYALLLTGNDWLSESPAVIVNLGNTVIKSTDEKTEAGTGYFKKRIEGDKVQQGMGNIRVTVSAPAAQKTTTPSYGAVYWQYFEDLDKISSSATPLKLVKKLYVEKRNDRGAVLQLLKDGDELKTGDKVKVRIELRVDRDMEYVHMKDLRAACMEPTNVLSGYKYQGGLGYYESTKDVSTDFFFGWLPKGTYVFEYPMFVTLSGNFSNGITSAECMYAPEFTAHSEGIRVSVGN